ncbi:hypothetical protein Tco_0431106 [Tanacetum coccineum]
MLIDGLMTMMMKALQLDQTRVQLTGKSAPAKDPVEEPTDKVMVDEQYTEDIPISDEGHIETSSYKSDVLAHSSDGIVEGLEKKSSAKPILKGKLDHLPKEDKVNLHNALNLEQPNWDASDFPFKEDYTIVFKPRAVIYRDRDDNRKMMRIDEVHKFSDGTVDSIKEMELKDDKEEVKTLSSGGLKEDKDQENLSKSGKLCRWTPKRY